MSGLSTKSGSDALKAPRCRPHLMFRKNEVKLFWGFFSVSLQFSYRKLEAILFEPVYVVTELERRSQLQSQILHHHLTF